MRSSRTIKIKLISLSQLILMKLEELFCFNYNKVYW